MEALNFTDLPRGETIQLDLSVFGFTLGCAVLTGLIFGLIPALQASRPTANDALQSGGTRTTGGRYQRSLRNALVVGEIALSLMLLTTAVLLTRSFQKLSSESPRFDPASVLTARLILPENAYGEDHQILNFVDRLKRDLGVVPGVETVGFSSVAPFGQSNSQGTYRIAGYTPPEGDATPHGQLRAVTPEYFEALKIPLMRGRNFTAFDHAETEQVVIVDQVLVDRYFPNDDPIGRQIYRGSDEATPGNVRTIVGVMTAVNQYGLDDPIRKETIYYPLSQRPVTGLTLTIRTAVPPATLIESVRNAVLNIDSKLPVYQLRTLSDRIDGSLQSRRTPMVLLGIFGSIALLLAFLGVYGALAFSVGQRTQEMGIRMAPGAAQTDVLQLILRQGIWLVGIGAGLGLLGYLAVPQLLQHLLYGMSPVDVVSFVGALVLLTGIAAIACYLPARRATRIDPMVALRDD